MSQRLTILLLALAMVGLPARHATAAPTKDQCIDAFTRAQDLRREHKLLASREAFWICAEQACPELVRSDCLGALNELKTALPSLVLHAVSTSGEHLSDVTVTVDGQRLTTRLDGSPIELDPGAHTFALLAKGLPLKVITLVIRVGERGRREPVVLGSPVQTAAGQPTKPPVVPLLLDDSNAPGLGTQQTVALWASGVGLGGLVVGGVFGVMALDRRNVAESQCPAACEDQEGVDSWSSARRAGNVSTVAFVSGGLALAAGGVLWLTARHAGDEANRVAFGVAPGSLRLRGAW